MIKERVFDLLRAVALAAQPGPKREFELSLAAGQVGGSRCVLIYEAAAVRAVEALGDATWRALQEGLNDAMLPWSMEIEGDLQRLYDECMAEAAPMLRAPMQRVEGAYPREVANSLNAVAAAERLRRDAIHARIALYVERRRREEAVSALAELEEALFRHDPDGALLGTVRKARRDAHSSQVEDRQLREALEVVSTGVSAVVAGHDLGGRLRDVISFFS